MSAASSFEPIRTSRRKLPRHSKGLYLKEGFIISVIITADR